MKHLAKVTFILVAVSVIIMGCAPQAAAPSEAAKTITVGILGSLTGPLRSIGEGAVCVQDYFTDLNESGGIKYKDPKTGKEEALSVKILMADHAWDAAKCVTLYERFKSQGMQFVFANGSAPTAAIYTAAARDKIPGLNVDTTCDPFIYELPKPYIAMDGPTLPAYEPGYVEYYADAWKKAGKTTKPKIGILAADVATRRVLDKPEMGFIDHVNRLLGDKLEFVGVTYIPVAPVDVKAELTKMVEKNVDIIMVEHWGSGACRVIISDAVALGLHKKGIWLNIMWLPSDVPLAEPKLFDEYNQYSLVQAFSHGYLGDESPEIQAKVPGLKKAFDLCAKYHNGQIPEQRAGWYYVYGVEYGMLAQQAITATLQKNGYAGFSTEALRDQLFAISPIDPGGLLPAYTPPPGLWATWLAAKCVDIKNGHMVTDLQTPWLGMGPTKIYPNLDVKYEGKYGYKTWTPTPWKP